VLVVRRAKTTKPVICPESAPQGSEKELVALIMPLFPEMLSQLTEARQAYEMFPSAIPIPVLS
jgi:hypothetical protein